MKIVDLAITAALILCSALSGLACDPRAAMTSLAAAVGLLCVSIARKNTAQITCHNGMDLHQNTTSMN